MKKNLLNYRTVATTLLCVVTAVGAAQNRITVSPIERSEPQPMQFRDNAPSDASMKMEETLIEENFDGMIFGSTENPDSRLLASYETSVAIPDEFMSTPGWGGHYVFSAGKAICLHNPDYQNNSWLATPTGDWSGRITVTFKAKALPCGITGADIQVLPAVGGHSGSRLADTDASEYKRIRLYPYQGWNKLTFTFDNRSANADGHILFLINGNAILDDIEITSENAFIAPPNITASYDYEDDGFTFSWDPVRNAFNYYVDLFEKKEDPNAKSLYETDFDTTEMDPKFSVTSASESNPVAVVENEGRNHSKGLRMHNGDVLVFDNATSLMKNFCFYLTTYASEDDYTFEEPNEYHPNYTVEMPGRFLMYVKDAKGNWSYYGYGNLKDFLPGFAICHELPEGSDEYQCYDLDKEAWGWFKDHYCGVRLEIAELPEDAYVVFDDFSIPVDLTFILERVPDSLQLNYSEDLDCYDIVKRDVNSYTFTGLDPYGEYYFGVRAHLVSYFSPSHPKEAFGVGKPWPEQPTLNGTDGFTLTWEEPCRATSYSVTLFGVKYSDGGTYEIFRETFDKIDDKWTSKTNPYDTDYLGSALWTPLDQFADNAGWIGMNTHICQGMCGTGEYAGIPAYFYTPEMDLSHNVNTILEILVYGEPMDRLVLLDEVGNGYAMNYTEDESCGREYTVHGTVELPFQPSETKKFTIFTETMTPFMIDEIAFSQVVPEERRVFNKLDTQQTVEPSITFSGLSPEYDAYAYQVTAIYSKDGKTAYSNPSRRMEVNMTTGEVQESNNKTLGAKAISCETTVETGRYSIDGLPVGPNATGLVIVTFSDGSTKKLFIK